MDGTRAAARRLLLFGLAASVLGGCATLRNIEPAHQPYRQSMLNADFSSAYPRPAHEDPFGFLPDGSPRGEAALALAAPPEETSSARPDPDAVDRGGAYLPNDAAAYVTAVYLANETQTTDAGQERPEIIDIYRHAQRSGTIYHSARPAVGDLVFFHNTFDRNGDGRNNDWYTHVGMVESVDDLGTVAVLSYLDGRVSRTYLNLEQPDQARNGDGDIINTVMRRRLESDPPYTQYLASELVAGFGSLLGDRAEFLVIDNWQPGMDVAAVAPGS